MKKTLQSALLFALVIEGCVALTVILEVFFSTQEVDEMQRVATSVKYLALMFPLLFLAGIPLVLFVRSASSFITGFWFSWKNRNKR